MTQATCIHSLLIQSLMWHSHIHFICPLLGTALDRFDNTEKRAETCRKNQRTYVSLAGSLGFPRGLPIFLFLIFCCAMWARGSLVLQPQVEPTPSELDCHGSPHCTSLETVVQNRYIWLYVVLIMIGFS